MYPGSLIHQFDKLDYEESCHDLDIEETESNDATNETRQVKPHTFELFDPQDTWCKHCNTERNEIKGMHL